MAKPKPKSEAPAGADELVTVVALCHLNEDNTHRAKGETFQISAARAAVLPELVSIVDTPAAD